MIFILPRWFPVSQKTQQSTPPDLVSGSLHEEGASAARTYKRVDFTNQIIRQQNVCSMCALITHIYNVPI